MASNKIRGITIEIGGDTSGLTKSLKESNSQISSTQKQLKDVEKLLKLDPTNTELLAQRQKLLADAVSETNGKLDELKKIQQTMDENGVDKNSEQYMALQREIVATEQSLEKLEKAAGSSNVTLSKISATADKIGAASDKIAQKTKAISAAAAAGVAAIGGLAYSSITAADEMNTLAKQTGFSTDELQKMQYASDLIDVSVEDITGSIKKLRKNMVSNSKDTAEAFARIGVSVTDTNGELRDSTDVFYDVLEGLSSITNETERDTVAMQIFGKSADDLAGIVDDGGKALKEYGKQAEDLGLILSQDTLDALNETNDKIDQLKATTRASLAEVGAKAADVLLPVIEKIIDKVSGLLDWLGNLDEGQIKTMLTIMAVVAAISPLASAISGISNAVSFITSTVIPGLSSAISFLLANPIVAIIAAVVALVALIATKGDEIQAILQRVDDFLQNIFATDFTEILGPVLGSALNGFFANVKNVWDSVKKIFDGIIDFIRGVFTGDWKRAWEGVKEIFGGIFSGLGALLKAPINGVISLINGAIGAINGLIARVNSGIGSLFGFNIGQIGDIPYLANGGVLSSGSAVVGEVGPEILTMQNGKAVVQPLASTNPTVRQANAATGTENINITVKSVLDGKVIGESVTNYQRGRERAYG